MKITQRVASLILPILEDKGCELVDIEFKKEGSVKVLRIYTDLLEGHISLDECAEINRIVSDLLDEADFIEETYVLEISSPGINRVLKKESDFIRFTGEKVEVALYEPLDGKKKFQAQLLGIDENGNIRLLPDDKDEIQLAKDKISKINLYFEF